MKMKRGAALLCALIMLTALPAFAFAETGDDAGGSSAGSSAAVGDTQTDDGYPDPDKTDESIDNTAGDKEQDSKAKTEQPAEAPVVPTAVKIDVREYSSEDMLLSSHDVMIGTELHLSANIEPADVTMTPALIWSSNDPNVVSVDSRGVAKMLEEGEATVTLSAGQLTDKINFNVTPKPVTGIGTTLLIGFGILVILIIAFIIFMIARVTRRKRREREMKETRSMAADKLKHKIEKQKAGKRRDTYLSGDGLDRRTRVFVPPIAADPDDTPGPPESGDDPGVVDGTRNAEPNSDGEGYETGPDRPFSLDDID
ncbi:MAG: hypothetical protein LBL36_03160 [Clostridiales Family XIII bacterium]|jgi:hypothetical protein|nr:hypothetical protein [Clostridiales Family XIII bacterium]